MTANNRHPAKNKEFKQASLPKVARLAKEGRSSRQIGDEIGVGKTTVNKWLTEIRARPAAMEPPDPAEEIRETIAMFKAMRQAAYDEWQAAKADKRITVTEESGPAAEPDAKIKTSVRTETRTGNTAYFTFVMHTQDRIDALAERLAALQGLPAAPADRLAGLSDDDLENLSDDDLENFDDDELYAMDLRLRAKYEREGQKFDRPVLTNEQIHNMTDEQRAGYRRADSPPPLEALAAPEAPEAENPVAAAAPQAADAQAAGNVAAIPPPPPETAAKADPPPLTWDQQHAAAVAAAAAQKAERKQRMKPYTDPRRCAYRWPM